MFEASTPSVDANGRPWYVTPQPKGGEWLAWNERELATNQSFPTVDAATAWVKRHDSTSS
jgi:hypothetical protein